MQLNWDAVRSILRALENSSTAETLVKFDDFPDLDPQEVGYHMSLLGEAGLVILYGNNVIYSADGTICMAGVTRLTLTGHKLLDDIRNDAVWTKVKARFAAAGVAMSLAAAGKVAEKITESLLGLSG